jgi:hypothetical protein
VHRSSQSPQNDIRLEVLIWTGYEASTDPESPHFMASPRLSQIRNHLASTDLVLKSYSTDGRVVTLTINNASRANCLSTPVLQALLSALKAINPRIPLNSSIDTEDPIIFAERVCKSHSPNPIPKVVILKSTGSIFCSGHDLREFHSANGNHETIHDIFRLCNTVMLTIRQLPQIVISQVSQQRSRLTSGSRNCDGSGDTVSRSSRSVRRISIRNICDSRSAARWILHYALCRDITEYTFSEASATDIADGRTILGATGV